MSWISAILFSSIFECLFNDVGAALLQQCDGCPALQPGSQYPPGTVQFSAESFPGDQCIQTITCNNLQKDIITIISIYIDPPQYSKFGDTSANISLHCYDGKWHYYDDRNLYQVATSHKYYCTGHVYFPYIQSPDKTPPTSIQQCSGCPTFTTHFLYPPEMLQSKAETFPNGTCKQTLAFNNTHYDLLKRLYGADSYAAINLTAQLEHPKYGNITTDLSSKGQMSTSVTMDCINGKWYGVLFKQIYEITPTYYKCGVNLPEYIENTANNSNTTTPENLCTYCNDNWGLTKCYTVNGSNCTRNDESIFFYTLKERFRMDKYFKNETTDYCVHYDETQGWGFCCCPKSMLLSPTRGPVITTTTTSTPADIKTKNPVGSGCDEFGFQRLCNQLGFRLISDAADPSVSKLGKFVGYFQNRSSCEKLVYQSDSPMIEYMYEPQNQGKCTFFLYSIDDKIVENASSTAVIYKKC